MLCCLWKSNTSQLFTEMLPLSHYYDPSLARVLGIDLAYLSYKALLSEDNSIQVFFYLPMQAERVSVMLPYFLSSSVTYLC